MDVLKYEYPCLYLYACEVLGIDCQAFKDLCECCEHGGPEIQVYHIHGFLIPLLAKQRAQKKLQKKKGIVHIFGDDCDYDGEFNEFDKGQGHGYGEDQYGRQCSGTFFNNKCHGVGK